MSEESKFFFVSKKESFSGVQYAITRDLVKSFVDGDKGSDLRNFECSFDDGRLYQFQWVERNNGFAYFAAFVKPKEIKRFLTENKKYARDIGFDPLSHGDMEAKTEVFVYSPNSFPSEEIESLRAKAKDAVIVLVTTKEVVAKTIAR